MRKPILQLMLFISAFFMFAVVSTPALAQDSAPPASDPSGSWFQNIPGMKYVFEDPDSNPKQNAESWREAFGSPDSCWGCTLYDKMREVTLKVGKQGEALFTDNAISAMNAFMGLWVVFQLYLMLSPSFANSPAQAINTIFQRIVLMMITLAILKMGPFTYIMEGFVIPGIDGILEAAQAVMPGVAARCGDGGTAGSQLICSMHIQMGRGVGIGGFLMDDANLNPFSGPLEIFQMIGGLIIFIAFGWMMLMLPFRLFDALIRIAVVSVIMPVVVLAYQFKPTRGVVKQAVTSVLAAALTFLFTAIAVAIATELISSLAIEVINAPDGQSNPDDFVGPLSAKDFMVLVAVACGMSAFIKQAGTIASEFAGFQGSMGNVGGGGGAAVAGAATMAAGVAGYAGGKAVAMGGKAAGKGAAMAGKAVMSRARTSSQSQKDDSPSPGTAGL